MYVPTISLVIPNYNGSATIGRCLEAACSVVDAGTEIIVVDDRSTDRSAEIIRRYPCTLVRQERHGGAGAARNAGARRAAGEYLFFIDADCLLLESTLPAVRSAIRKHEDAVIGGTYTPLPVDEDFFSSFQSVFIHYNETRRSEPDYIAAHALVVRTDVFRAAGGFPEPFLPMIEDVELSHRLRRAGRRLVMDPGILVRHIFNFTIGRSLANAFRKSRHWTVYSLRRGDAFADSGTASRGLKVNVAAFTLNALIVLAAAASDRMVLAAGVAIPLGVSVVANRGLFRSFRSVDRRFFALYSSLYYHLLYPAPVAAGALAGMVQHLTSPRLAGTERACP